MSGAAFYKVQGVAQTVVNLCHGWGYNFYRTENQLRADDLLVRSKVCELLGEARGAVEAAEASWRRERLPAPTRAKPLPDPEAVKGARVLEGLSRGIGALEGQVRGLPAPAQDRMSERLRSEAAVLQDLLQADLGLVGRAEELRALVVGAAGEALIGEAGRVQGAIAATAAAVAARQGLLVRLG
jgi:hypothetical protein